MKLLDWQWFAAALLLAACSGNSGSSDAENAPASHDGGPGSERDGKAPDNDGATPEAASDAANDVASDAGGTGVACSGTSPSFAKDVTPILQRSCAGGEICHGGIGPAWTYKQLVNAPAGRDCSNGAVIVTPGDLDKSYLVHKITGIGMCGTGSRMPRGGPALPSAEIQAIADWICTGATNN